jgi:hypothetical protein
MNLTRTAGPERIDQRLVSGGDELTVSSPRQASPKPAVCLVFPFALVIYPSGITFASNAIIPGESERHE